MSEIVVSDRAVPRILAVVPAAVVALCVRVLTLGTPPVQARVAAAAVVAFCCWVSYRLLTVKVTLGESSIRVRGVFYDAEISYDDLEAAVVAAPGWSVRALMWGLMRPHTVELRTGNAKLRPLALVSAADSDDDDVHRVLRALLVRCGTRLLPAKRDTNESSVSAS